jgi:hypothetical protein
MIEQKVKPQDSDLTLEALDMTQQVPDMTQQVPDSTMQDLDLTMWEARWKDLNGTLEMLGENYNPSTLLNFSRKETLYNVVRCLQSFARDQFYFFYDGFLNGRLKESSEFPIEYALQAVLAQVAYDLEAILRAADQRISGSPQVKQTLDTADKLAWTALQPAKDKKLVDNETTVLTYFQKSSAIRLIPYAPVALVGIPFTAVSIEQDYLAIAHEVGHYVYRHGRLIDDSVKSKKREPVHRRLDSDLSKSPEWIKKWQEEIFADVYGCLVGGPVMALSAQDLAFQASAKEFVLDDKEHPKPIVRPDIYSKILSASVKELDNRWKKKRAERGDPESPSVLEDTRKPMYEVISKIKALLPDAPSERWTKDERLVKEDIEILYDQFKDFVSNLKSNGVQLEELKSDPTSNLWEKWIEEKGFFGGSPPPMGVIKPGTEEDLLDPEPEYGTWIHVLLAGGWSNKIRNHASP